MVLVFPSESWPINYGLPRNEKFAHAHAQEGETLT